MSADGDGAAKLGRYSSTVSAPAGGLRPLRAPDAPGLDDDGDDGSEE
ncbi:hypothetical protein [Streptomyces anulatus]